MTIDWSTPAPATVHTFQPRWPEPLGDAAYHGPAGEFVRIVSPHTEADPAALLVQFLVGFGNMVGRTCYATAEADRHYANLSAVLVGETAKGRKGTSLGRTRNLLALVDEAWARDRVQSGLSSGEGLIWAVRDPIFKREAIREKKKVIGYEEVEADAGIEDKRLLVIESEFASTLRVLQRDGNTLSATVRQAWDTGTLRTLTKTSPATATAAHISILGHVTRDELRRYLDRTELGNGFANRILWVAVRRARVLPEGGSLDPRALDPLAAQLRSVVGRVQDDRELRRTPGARAMWAAVYESLSDGRPGLLGAVTSRSEAQVLRLSMLYSVLDSARAVGVEHLAAALEVWRFAFDSARYIFGDAVGNELADEILDALRREPDGLSRTDIRNLVGRHQRGSSISAGLALLKGTGLASREIVQTPGRSIELWRALAGDIRDQRDQSPSDRDGADPSVAFIPYVPPLGSDDSQPGRPLSGSGTAEL